MLGSLGHRVHSAALDFASWAPSTGVLLLLDDPRGRPRQLAARSGVRGVLGHAVGMRFGDAGFSMSLRHWINDGLLTIFFLVVGLEIKREFTVGRLASRRSAALADRGRASAAWLVPALLYLARDPAGPLEHGWGVPMATDTAFAVALIVMLGARVPVELRIFLTAAAIVDDIGAIVVVALFYSGDAATRRISPPARRSTGRCWRCSTARASTARCRTRCSASRSGPACTPAACTRRWPACCSRCSSRRGRRPTCDALMVQANADHRRRVARGEEVLRHGPSDAGAARPRRDPRPHRIARRPLLRARRALVELRRAAAVRARQRRRRRCRSSVVDGHEPLILAIVVGLVLGKPLGIVLAAALAVWLGVAVKPAAYSWRQLAGAGALAGIGFTMSLFIAGQAFPSADDFAAAKIAVFAASILSAVIGVAVLWRPRKARSRSRTAVRSVRAHAGRLARAAGRHDAGKGAPRWPGTRRPENFSATTSMKARVLAGIRRRPGNTAHGSIGGRRPLRAARAASSPLPHVRQAKWSFTAAMPPPERAIRSSSSGELAVARPGGTPSHRARPRQRPLRGLAVARLQPQRVVLHQRFGLARRAAPRPGSPAPRTGRR